MKQEQSRGKKNWLKLKNIILSKTLANKRKDMKFNLFDKHTDHMGDHIVTTYSFEQYKFVQKSPQPIYKQLLHFESQVDATGKWVWEAEQIGAYLFLKIGEAIVSRVEDKQISILQLGAGSSGLAGIALAHVATRHSEGLKVLLELTDGQTQNIEYLAMNLKENLAQSCFYKAERLVWGDKESMRNTSLQNGQKNTFNVIILCDCLYFVDFHKELIATIDSFLSEWGSVYAINPSRGQSMTLFLQAICQRGFQHELLQLKDERFLKELSLASKEKDFIEDKHYPYLIRLWRQTL